MSICTCTLKYEITCRTLPVCLNKAICLRSFRSPLILGLTECEMKEIPFSANVFVAVGQDLGHRDHILFAVHLCTPQMWWRRDFHFSVETSIFHFSVYIYLFRNVYLLWNIADNIHGGYRHRMHMHTTNGCIYFLTKAGGLDSLFFAIDSIFLKNPFQKMLKSYYFRSIGFWVKTEHVDTTFSTSIILWTCCFHNTTNLSWI